MMEDFNSFVGANLAASDAQAATEHSTVVCLATQNTPVLFVSKPFEAHTGYASHEVIGRNLSLLQGPETEQKAVERFSELIRNGEPGVVTITNYRKDGTKFVHACEMRPIFGAAGTVTHFVAIQRPV